MTSEAEPTHEPTEALPDVHREYGVFNDETFFGPLFEAGTIPEAQRFLVDDPIYTSASLWQAHKHAKNTEFDRRAQGKLGTYGKPVVRVREVIRTAWTDVAPEEIEAVRR